MTERITVRLAEGCRVRLPDGHVLPQGDVVVDRTPFILRRLAAGDLVLAPPPARPTPKKG